MNRFLMKLTDNILLHYEVNGFAPRLPHIRNITNDLLKRCNFKVRNDYGFLFVEHPELNWKNRLSIKEIDIYSNKTLDIFKYDKKRFTNMLHNKSFNPSIYSSIYNKDINYTEPIETISKKIGMEKISPDTLSSPIYFKYIET